MLPRVVLLTGEPGSGKTTLGRALGERLGIPFLARDEVRRAIWLSSGSLPSRADATEAFLCVVEAMAAAGMSCIVEYVVRATQPEHLERLGAVADVVVVVVSCADPVRRRAERGADAAQEAHMRSVTAAMRTTFPESIPVLAVRTDEGYEPPLPAIAEFAVARPGA